MNEIKIYKAELKQDEQKMFTEEDTELSYT